MNGISVDTNIFSYVFKSDSRAEIYRSHLNTSKLYLSFMVVAELYRWSIQRNWGAARVDALKKEIDSFTILNHDDETSWEWARIRSIRGNLTSESDAWIAACAIRHSMPLLTHNQKHFQHIPGLVLIDA